MNSKQALRKQNETERMNSKQAQRKRKETERRESKQALRKLKKTERRDSKQSTKETRGDRKEGQQANSKETKEDRKRMNSKQAPRKETEYHKTLGQAAGGTDKVGSHSQPSQVPGTQNEISLSSTVVRIPHSKPLRPTSASHIILHCVKCSS
ncbi:hypothetical protein Pcinc_044474 [Petrolisthes cinctipes]|uniref:Uncharacterized protein n=1 Tax=Petrolisthes cinctipes TaxID=88211 RepID=A0AAE1BEA9_PETCI|nr:hypothetical protein Pcinc_044474 [Petrolisthes cinctipes]